EYVKPFSKEYQILDLLENDHNVCPDNVQNVVAAAVVKLEDGSAYFSTNIEFVDLCLWPRASK
nr:hypothetical protein [Tanacetum cinerariifolium]